MSETYNVFYEGSAHVVYRIIPKVRVEKKREIFERRMNVQ